MARPSTIAVRNVLPEIMDRPDLEPARHELALSSIARLNRWAATHRILWKPLANYAARARQPLRVLDIACGAGDTAVELYRRAKRSNLPLTLSGCDVSQRAVDFAQAFARDHDAEVDFFQHDVLSEGLPEGYDVVTCSLFLHHLDHEAAIALLRELASKTHRLILVQDLARSRLGHLTAYAASRLLTRSDVVRYDAPVSVRAAFTVDEVRDLTRIAGWTEYTIERKWPFRFLLQWSRS